VRAYVTTCEGREAVCAETLALLAATDWGCSPIVVFDRSQQERPLARILETGRRLLEQAVEETDQGTDDVFLYLEDDLAFNRWIRHNLERWPPIIDRRPGDHLFASLYNPNIVPRASAEDPATAIVIDPRQFYGAQAMLMSAVTARRILDEWDDAAGPLDLRISRLGARWSPVWFHRPSLVQHRPVPSASGGSVHAAIDFEPEWRADGRATVVR
jgi:hypothetical protein